MATVFFSKDSRAGRDRGTPFQTRRFKTIEEAQAWANEQHANNEWFACRHVSACDVKALPRWAVRLLKVIEWQKPEINPVTVESLEQLLQVLGIALATDIKKAVCKTVFGVGGYSFFVTKDGIKLVGSRNSHEFVYPFDMHELEQLAFIYDDSDLAKHLNLNLGLVDEEAFIYDDDDTDLAVEYLVNQSTLIEAALRERINPRLHAWIKVVKSSLGIQFYVNNKQVGKTVYFAFTVDELTAALDAVNQRANVSLFQFIFTPSIKRVTIRLIQFLWRL